MNDTLIGPFFIGGNLNARAYEELLKNQIVPRIREITGDNFQNIWFQPDGAAAHYGREVRAYLDTRSLIGGLEEAVISSGLLDLLV